MDFPNLVGQDVFADVETTGLKWWQDGIFGVAVRVNKQNYYYDIRRHPNAVKWLKDQLPQARRFVNHNIKFDLHMLREAGVIIPDHLPECTMVQAALINEHEYEYTLDHLAEKYLARNKIDIIPRGKELLGMKKNARAKDVMGRLCELPESVVAEYAMIDVELAELLYHRNLHEIEEQNLHKVWGLEKRLLPVLLRMEERGVMVDVDAAERASEILLNRINILQKRIKELAGGDININSSKQLIELFKPIKDPADDRRWVIEIPGRAIPIPSTESGAPSLGTDTLRRVPGELPSSIIEIRKLIKTRDTFIRGHILGHQVDGLIHCNYNQTKNDADAGTGTGRLSVTAPALQQIHKRNKEIAAVVRSIFIPYPGQKWASADWDQKEFRWFAHYANNPTINKMYEDNPDTDFHQAVADLTGLPRSPVDGIKGNAKQINLGLVFGMGKGKMAQEMDLPYSVVYRRDKEYLNPGPEAEELFRKYNESVPGIAELLENAASVASSRGYVMTVMGRHIRFPGGKATHKAGGLIFQGSAADSMKLKMIELDREFSDQDVNLLLSVHDETDFSLDPDPVTTGRIKEILECFDGINCEIKCKIPIRSTVTVADNWWEACK